MKITIQPTELDIITNYPHPTVSVEIPGDYLTMDQMISDLIIQPYLHRASTWRRLKNTSNQMIFID